jgi:cytochrome c-type biogenesis protein CcsB
MKKIFTLLFSSRVMAVLIAIFAISIAVATFIENDYGSQTARATVYYSWWFELMLLVGIVNLLGSMVLNKLYRWPKLTIFTFHLAFVFILLGATVTHFFGFEGFVHIRNGETSNTMVSDNTYLSVTVANHQQTAHAEKRVYFSALTDNYHKVAVQLSNQEVLVECLQITPNAIKKIDDDAAGQPILELVVAANNGKETVLLADKQTEKIGNIAFSFNDTTNTSGVNIIYSNDELRFRSVTRTASMTMATQAMDTLPANIFHPFALRTLYNFGGISVVAKSFNPKGKISVTTDKDAKRDENPDALHISVSVGGESQTLLYFAAPNALNAPAEVKIANTTVSVAFGAKVIPLPFSLHLNKFTLERYPGSESPSRFESSILLQDNEMGIHEEHRIFMNNVMKHRGFRFYQSSYDSDEGGTILSVNYDFWGTTITYFGYLMLAIGIVLSVMNKNSRFRRLSAELRQLRKLRTTAPAIVLLMLCSATVHASEATLLPNNYGIDKQHAAKFGRMMVQDMGGRTKPINSLSSELLRKVSRKTSFMGLNSDQVLLGMIVYPEYWQTIPMIRVTHPKLQEILKAKEGYASFLDFMDTTSVQHAYILSQYVSEAYRKKPAKRDQFDTEIIRLDERVNLCYLVYTGNVLRIFPKPGDARRTWYSPTNAAEVFTGKDSMFIPKIIPMYAQSIKDAGKTGNWSVPDEILGALYVFQHKYGGDIIPSDFKIKTEILYNESDIFDRLGSVYGLAGFVLLVFQFLSVFIPRMNLKPLIRIVIIVIIACFALHLAGLLTRWYISGHAPWTNAFESLVFIAFSTVLAGIIFSRKSAITISATALMAWLILFVAHLSWMDPEITNLVPVLKSYWLLIHVAVITASYGFMALGALLAFINLVMMIVQSPANKQATANIIAELSLIIEMTLIIGLFMLTIGTFLGGVWANESWGRYWGWDPKETWALVSVLVYAFIAHMRMVPGLKGNYIFNLMALAGFSSIIMTYFGVNYYLSGLHSYAKGDPLPVPSFVYYAITTVVLLAVLAWVNQRKQRQTTLPAK